MLIHHSLKIQRVLLMLDSNLQEIMKRSTNNVNTASDGNNTNNINAVSLTVNAAGIEVNAVGAINKAFELPNDLNMLNWKILFHSIDG
ncbi:hypothetical protein Tco_0208998 [Tanacetum coccineum]